MVSASGTTAAATSTCARPPPSLSLIADLAHTQFTLEPNKTYRLRLVHTGSFASIRFSVDYHALTVVEVDGTLVAPYAVSGVTLAVAQRYSVLLTTNQTAGEGKYWMRAGLQSDMFTYDQPGQNLDIRGVVRCVALRALVWSSRLLTFRRVGTAEARMTRVCRVRRTTPACRTPLSRTWTPRCSSPPSSTAPAPAPGKPSSCSLSLPLLTVHCL